MRKISLIAALVAATLSTAAVAADWVYVAASSNFEDYIDRESIRTMSNGNKRAWVLRLYKKPNEWGFTSGRGLKEFDCREGRTRSLQLTGLKGGVVTTTNNDISEWSYVEPESVNEAQLNYVCFGKLPQ